MKSASTQSAKTTDQQLDEQLKGLTYFVPLGKQEANYDIQEHRRKLLTLKPAMAPDDSVVKKALLLPVSQHRKIPAIIYRSKHDTSDNEKPTIIYVAGTAFIAHETAYTDLFCTLIAALTGCQVIVVQHRLAPEDAFPAQKNDVTDACLFLFKSAVKFKIDLNRVVTLGYSTGGTFISQLGAKAKEINMPIALQILVSPVLDLARTTKEFKEFEKQDEVIPEDFVKWFFNLYLPKGLSRKDPDISPAFIKDLNQMPPTSIIFGEFDRFRGDSEKFAQRLGDKLVNKLVNRILCPKQNHGLFWNRPHEVYGIIAALIKANLSFTTIMKPLVDLDSGKTGSTQKLISNTTTHSISKVDQQISTISISVDEKGNAEIHKPTNLSSRNTHSKSEELQEQTKKYAPHPNGNSEQDSYNFIPKFCAIL